jgi:hypothetical protein
VSHLPVLTHLSAVTGELGAEGVVLMRYEVDVPAMHVFAVNVFALGGDVRGTLGELNAAACVDVGDGALAAALTVFGHAWADFTEASAQAVDATGGAIQAASAGYVQTDNGVVADLQVASAFVDAVAAGGDGSAALSEGIARPSSSTEPR